MAAILFTTRLKTIFWKTSLHTTDAIPNNYDINNKKYNWQN